jgi:hypothetical protein
MPRDYKNVNYSVYDINSRALLKESITYDTDIKPLYEIDTPHIRLLPQGRLLIREGYKWDMATGAVDTPDMIYASLAHDALCELTNEGLLDWSYRKDIDKYFLRLLKELGTSRFRRWYVYIAVRAYSLFMKSKVG